MTSNLEYGAKMTFAMTLDLTRPRHMTFIEYPCACKLQLVKAFSKNPEYENSKLCDKHRKARKQR
ncbi:MAG: hypothetical protein WAM42_19310 [Candidatus Nitrosopolaris sp.]